MVENRAVKAENENISSDSKEKTMGKKKEVKDDKKDEMVCY